MTQKFLNSYYEKFIDLLYCSNPEFTFKQLKKISSKLSSTKNKNKIIIIGNGGSAAIASHFAIDICKNTKLVCQCFNDSSMITCLANDFGYENWTKKAIEYYGKKGDVLIAISSSGSSKNILNACLEAKKKKFSSIITLSGFQSNNLLKNLGTINMWVNSKIYNIVENVHQVWLLSIIDLINKNNIKL